MCVLFTFQNSIYFPSGSITSVKLNFSVGKGEPHDFGVVGFEEVLETTCVRQVDTGSMYGSLGINFKTS